LQLTSAALDSVLVMRTPGGRATNLPDTVVALDTWVGYTDIVVIHHTGKHLISALISHLDDK
jgi:hypothetical protein